MKGGEKMGDREFRGIWIPKEVWLDERLNPLEKIILFEIDSLDKTDSGCFASNEYIAKFCQCSDWKVSNAITKLVNLGYIKIVAFDGRHRKIKSCLGFSLSQPCETPNSALGNPKAINISNSNTRDKHNISSIDDEFSIFWSAYPRHDGKQDALKAWKSLKPNADLQKTILDDIRRRLDFGGAWYKTEKRYIKMAGSYLRGKRWEDEQSDDSTGETSNDSAPDFINHREHKCIDGDERKSLYKQMGAKV